MANEPKDPKVVSGGEVVFEGGTPQADSLDGVVQATGAGSTSVAADWELENMKHLAGELARIMGKSFTPVAQGVIPYLVYGLKDNPGWLRLAIAPTIQAGILRQFLEAEFGPELAQSGIYEATGLGSDMNQVQLATLLPYFPEFEEVVKLNNSIYNIRIDPYQSLLAFLVEARPFFTGAIKAAGYQQEQGSTATWHLPLTLKDVLVYAKEVNQLPKVKEYMDILNKVKEGK